MSGTLYCCATPIGNLSDASPRLIETLNSVALIAAEDTRVTQKLCHHFNIQSPLLRLDKFTEQQRVDTLLTKAKNGESIALVSDAGTPAISDPGARIVAAFLDHELTVVPIVGPSSISAILSVSGFSADKFSFVGYLPRKHDALLRLLQTLPAQQPIVFLESPKRLVTSLKTLNESNRITGQL